MLYTNVRYGHSIITHCLVCDGVKNWNKNLNAKKLEEQNLSSKRNAVKSKPTALVFLYE